MKQIVRYVKIRSSRSGHAHHTVVEYHDGTRRCDCEACFYRGKCRHLAVADQIVDWHAVDPDSWRNSWS